MSIRNPVKYTPAEKQSFKTVPPTCDAIDKKFNELSNYFDKSIAESSLLGNGVEITPKIMDAIREAVTRHQWQVLKEMADTAKFYGTYPLRLALIREIESNIEGPHQQTHYTRWIEEGRGSIRRSEMRRANCK